MSSYLVGLDEAGMGTLAGPMTAAVVVIREDLVPKGVRDSKKLSDDQREELAARIMEAASYYKVTVGLPGDIDKKGLSQIWEGAMWVVANAAHEYLKPLDLQLFGRFIVDGNRFIPGAPYVEPVVKADATHPAVSAASILAKYTQCCWMDDYHKKYPRYGFNKHRGYGTPDHLRMLKELGPCPVHRMKYKPVKNVFLSR